MAEQRGFDPSRHLSLVNGNEYLEVKHRIVWLRSEHPDADIETELVSYVNSEAIFKATVTIPDGGSSTGWGSENAQGFGDYIEKAETKALGRALAALGYGTQFCTDHDFGASAGRVVDSPVKTGGFSGPGAPAVGRNEGAGATQRQMGAIFGASKRRGLDKAAIGDLAYDTIGVREIGDWNDNTGERPAITGKQASDLITAINALPEHAPF